MYIIILENEGFWAMKVTIFQIVVKKCVSGLIMNKGALGSGSTCSPMEIEGQREIIIRTRKF